MSIRASRAEDPHADQKSRDAIEARRPAFLSRRRADIVKLRHALTAGNFALVQKIGHNCKGIGAGYGFPEISSLGLAIENAAKARDQNRVLVCTAQLELLIQIASASEGEEACQAEGGTTRRITSYSPGKNPIRLLTDMEV